MQPNEPNSSRDFLSILTERGFIHQCSDVAGIDALAAAGKVVAYVGYDCTAPSLHVGILHLDHDAALAAEDRRSKPIALMGGGTTRVGDPSGRDETRKILTLEEIEANKRASSRSSRVPDVRRRPSRRRSWSTTPSGWRRSTTSTSCATSAGTSRSTAC